MSGNQIENQIIAVREINHRHISNKPILTHSHTHWNTYWYNQAANKVQRIKWFLLKRRRKVEFNWLQHNLRKWWIENISNIPTKIDQIGHTLKRDERWQNRPNRSANINMIVLSISNQVSTFPLFIDVFY